MQDVLAGEADRAENLMRDRCAFLRRLRRSGSSRRSLRGKSRRRMRRRARSRRRPNGGGHARRRPRRRAAPDCAAPPGICRSAARRRRARWRSAPSCRGLLPARRRSGRCAPTHPSASARSGRCRPAPARRERLHAIECDGVGRLARQIAARRRAGTLSSRPARPTTLPASTARCSASLANGTPRARPLSVPSAFSVMRSPGRAGATVIGARRRREAGTRQQPAGEQRFGERHRDRVAPRNAEHRKAFRKLRARAACSSGTHASVSPVSASACQSVAFQPSSCALLMVCGSARSAKMRAAVSATISLSLTDASLTLSLCGTAVPQW